MASPHIIIQICLALQYTLQGTLYGIQLKCLPIILRQTGSSLFLIGSLNLLTFPWLIKSLWAPILDRCGKKNLWLSVNYAGIGIALSLAKTDNHAVFSTSLVLLNLCSATVDLTLGKITIVNFHGRDLSKASSLQIISYKLGFLFGGGIALLLSDFYFSGDSVARLGFMSGIAGQGISIAVASVCGILLTTERLSPTQMLLLTSILTVFSVALQLYAVFSCIHGNSTFIVFVLLLQGIVHGSQASPVYTLMLRCSQNAPPSSRTTCYSFLGTLEILGKQLSLFLAGVLAELFGYGVGLSASLAVSLMVVTLVWCCPVELKKTSV
ncbi:major facilitator superfamily domain-containing protein 3-like isoform X2 [Acropora palmata]|uniref:major facilitator superfamily domain-containing protein 3-like isoform X2 n=1 Tax=Acropora palmata TaxID=6131 RepID=UPI003DA12554